MIFRAAEDADLIRQAARGNVEAYNLLVSRWERRVFNYLLRLLANREDALDVSQEVFLKAYQNLPKLDAVEKFAGWLFRIAHNEAFLPEMIGFRPPGNVYTHIIGVDIVRTADVSVVTLVPGTGDDVQALKALIAELGDGDDDA